MQPGAPPTQAFQLQEMGTDGTGSLERSDLESTKFWCGYPTPFLDYYYKTFPEEEADAPIGGLLGRGRCGIFIGGRGGRGGFVVGCRRRGIVNI